MPVAGPTPLLFSISKGRTMQTLECVIDYARQYGVPPSPDLVLGAALAGRPGEILRIEPEHKLQDPRQGLADGVQYLQRHYGGGGDPIELACVPHPAGLVAAYYQHHRDPIARVTVVFAPKYATRTVYQTGTDRGSICSMPTCVMRSGGMLLLAPKAPRKWRSPHLAHNGAICLGGWTPDADQAFHRERDYYEWATIVWDAMGYWTPGTGFDSRDDAAIRRRTTRARAAARRLQRTIETRLRQIAEGGVL